MASNIRTIQKSVGTTPEAGAGSGFQFYTGAGILLALSADFSASADAGTVVDIYDGVASTGNTVPVAARRTLIYTQTGNTDLGTTVPVVLQGDADLVAGTATAGVGTGLIFTDGLFVDVTLDVAGPQNITLWIKPLIKKSVRITTTGAAGSGAGAAQIWQGPALWHGYAITLNPLSPTTTDIVFRDAITDAAPTVMTKTNYATTPGVKVLRKVVTTTGEDEAGAVVTTAATGAYNNPGIYLRTGLRAVIAQSDAFDDAASIDAVFEK